MNETTKYIMPLLFNDKCHELIDNENGFINAYLSDINKPYLCNHIFLMYESKPLVLYKIKSICNKNKYFHHDYSLKINNIWYTVFIFIRPDKYKPIIESIITGERYGIPFCTKVVIQRFWEYRADSIEFNCLFNSPTANLYITPKDKLKPMIVDTIQEEDPPSETLLEQFGIESIE